MNEPCYKILSANNKQVIIEDLGGQYRRSVTNGAEHVVADLFKNDFLIFPGQKLFYIDSMGYLDEILHDGGGKFEGFKTIHPRK